VRITGLLLSTWPHLRTCVGIERVSLRVPNRRRKEPPVPDEEMEQTAEALAEDAVDTAVAAEVLHEDAVEKAVEAEALYAAADELAAEAIVEEVVAEDMAADAVAEAEIAVATAEAADDED
jgi:hypothetical protein